MLMSEREGSAWLDAQGDEDAENEAVLERLGDELPAEFVAAAVSGTHEDTIYYPGGKHGKGSRENWATVLGEFCSSSTDIDEQAFIVGLCAAGRHAEAQMRSLALLQRCGRHYCEQVAEDMVPVYLADAAGNLLP